MILRWNGVIPTVKQPLKLFQFEKARLVMAADILGGEIIYLVWLKCYTTTMEQISNGKSSVDIVPVTLTVLYA